jgi:hypothetical protein
MIMQLSVLHHQGLHTYVALLLMWRALCITAQMAILVGTATVSGHCRCRACEAEADGLLLAI